MKLAYSAEAIIDLNRLRAFIAEKDPAAAQRVGHELVQRLEDLRSFPEMGRPVELAPDPNTIRDAVFGKYIVRYSIHRETVIILRLWHHTEKRGRSIY